MPKWKLSTEFTFDAAHFIRDYDGSCGRMHGHTYKVRIEATSSQLHASEYCPHPVMVADFRTLRWAKQDLLKGGLDHSANPSDLSWAEDQAAQIPTDVVKLLQPEWVHLIATRSSLNTFSVTQSGESAYKPINSPTFDKE
ncbi:MAG: hypothetical protein OHK0047_10240 [Leptolyngbyaceae cyanobacterium]